MARKQILHTKARLPTAIHLSLWPYATRNAAYVYNNTLMILDFGSKYEEAVMDVINTYINIVDSSLCTVSAVILSQFVLYN